MPKRTLQGIVVSDKQDKTVVVRVERRFTHPMMKKTVRRSKKYHAHDEKNEYSVGDIVWIDRASADFQAQALGRDRRHQEGEVTGADRRQEGHEASR